MLLRVILGRPDSTRVGTLSWLAIAGASSLALYPGCGDSDRPDAPPSITGGSSASSGGTRSSGGATSGGANESGIGGAEPSGGASSAGEPGVGGDAAGGGEPSGAGTPSGGGETGEGGVPEPAGGVDSGPDPFACEPESMAGAPPTTEPLCDPALEWEDGERLEIPLSGTDVLFAISPDELSLAWGADQGFSGAILVADRADPDSAFDDPQQITDELIVQAQELALSPDRLRLVAAVNGRLYELSRAEPGATFEAPEEGAFAELDLDAETNGLTLGDPVISTDDLTLYYSILNAGPGQNSLLFSTRAAAEAWPVGSALDDCELERHERGVRQPTGISADGLTLFYYDGARGISRAAFRPAIGWPFDRFVDFPGLLGVQPNAACDRLYYSGPGELPLEVQVAARR